MTVFEIIIAALLLPLELVMAAALIGVVVTGVVLIGGCAGLMVVSLAVWAADTCMEMGR